MACLRDELLIVEGKEFATFVTSMRRLYLQPPLYLLLFKRDGHSFVFCLKHWCRSDDETDSDRINEEGDNLLKYIAITVLFESVP